MTAVYVIVKDGVYAHHFPGVWSTLPAAISVAAAASHDEGDGYHDWLIYEYPVDGEPPLDPAATVGWHRRRGTEFVDGKLEWTPISGFGWWYGDRTDSPPPHPLAPKADQ